MGRPVRVPAAVQLGGREESRQRPALEHVPAQELDEEKGRREEEAPLVEEGTPRRRPDPQEGMLRRDPEVLAVSELLPHELQELRLRRPLFRCA